MIQNKRDLIFYLLADAEAHDAGAWRWWHRLKHPTLWFQRSLRHFEYHNNRSPQGLRRIWSSWLHLKFRLLSMFLGFSIPPNTCGPGLCIPHYGTIVVSPSATLGENCKIHTCVNIGLKNGKAPSIGSNVYIGPGAKLFGDICVGDNVVIGANAVVNRNVPNNVTVAGVPAEVIGESDQLGIVVDGVARARKKLGLPQVKSSAAGS
jgi:serine O-acetyltransferase